MSETASNPAEADAPRAEPAPPPLRDTSQILITDWERREMPPFIGLRDKGFQVLVRQTVLNQIHRHGLSATDIEVCGVLVGNVYHDPSGPWLYIEKAIEGNH